MVVIIANDWVVIGMERSLSDAYEIANWDSFNSSRYAELTSGLTEDQITSLDNNAEFLKSYIAYDSIEGHGSGVSYLNSNDRLSIKDENSAEVVFIQYPEAFRTIDFIPDDIGSSDGWYVLCGRVYDSDYLKIKGYSYSLQDAVEYAKTGDQRYMPQDAILAVKSLLLRKLLDGYEADGAPYLKLSEISRKRWIILDKYGNNVSGVSYEELNDAAAVVMRIYDFCECDEWLAYKNAQSEPMNCAKVGIALSGRAVVGVA